MWDHKERRQKASQQWGQALARGPGASLWLVSANNRHGSGEAGRPTSRAPTWTSPVALTPLGTIPRDFLPAFGESETCAALGMLPSSFFQDCFIRISEETGMTVRPVP